MAETADRRLLMHPRVQALCAVMVLALYAYDLGGHDIWHPNEAFYAESVREMLENGDWLAPQFNYEPRLQKPPMTYWLMLPSVAALGPTELAVRLPITLCAIGSVLLTMLIGTRLHGRRVGVVAALAMALSFQFAGNTRYASPEVPLTFFFTLTLYLFLRGRQTKSCWSFGGAYVALGLTVLTKGFPFLLVIGAILVVHLWWAGDWKLRALLAELRATHLVPGALLATLIGGGWYVYAYLVFGDAFYEVQLGETVARAFTHGNTHWADVFYYPVVIAWGFLPYSLTFLAAVYWTLRTRENAHGSSFELSWFLVVLIVFTIARGKLPTYVIPAHPAMSILVARLLAANIRWTGPSATAYAATFIAPTVLCGLAVILAAFALGLWPALLLGGGLLALTRWSAARELAPFVGVATVLAVFVGGVLPSVEQVRPYDQIGRVIRGLELDAKTPVYAEGKRFDNLPFYSRRKTYWDIQPDEIRSRTANAELVALVFCRSVRSFPDATVLWRGLRYDGGSESQPGKLVREVIKRRWGQPARIGEHCLIHREAP